MNEKIIVNTSYDLLCSICHIKYKNLYLYQICRNSSRFYTGIAWHVLNYIYTRRVICTNKKTFYMQKEENISLERLYER